MEKTEIQKLIEQDKEEIKFKIIIAAIYIVFYWKEVTHLSYAVKDLADINSFVQIFCTLMLRTMIAGLLTSALFYFLKLRFYEKYKDEKKLDYLALTELYDSTFSQRMWMLILSCIAITVIFLMINGRSTSLLGVTLILCVADVFFALQAYQIYVRNKPF